MTLKDIDIHKSMYSLRRSGKAYNHFRPCKVQAPSFKVCLRKEPRGETQASSSFWPQTRFIVYYLGLKNIQCIRATQRYMHLDSR